MAEQTFNIEFDGYWREPKIEAVPSLSGIYCVYECVFNVETKTVTLLKLIYIGESGKVKEEIKNHKKWNDWKKHVRENNQLCFTFARVSSEDRNRVEAALIFKHKPLENIEYRDSFPFDKTTIISTGTTALLNTNFSVNRT